MKVHVRKIQQAIDKLQEIVDEAKNRDTTEVNTQCNTFRMHSFVSFESDGYLDLDADIDDLIDAPEFDDEM